MARAVSPRLHCQALAANDHERVARDSFLQGPPSHRVILLLRRAGPSLSADHSVDVFGHRGPGLDCRGHAPCAPVTENLYDTGESTSPSPFLDRWLPETRVRTCTQACRRARAPHCANSSLHRGPSCLSVALKAAGDTVPERSWSTKWDTTPAAVPRSQAAVGGLSWPGTGSCSHQGPCPSPRRPQGGPGHALLQVCALELPLLKRCVHCSASTAAGSDQAWPAETWAAGPAQRALAQHAWPIATAQPVQPGRCCTPRRPVWHHLTAAAQGCSQGADAGRQEAPAGFCRQVGGAEPLAEDQVPGLTRCCCRAQTRAGSCSSSRGWSRPWSCRA